MRRAICIVLASILVSAFLAAASSCSDDVAAPIEPGADASDESPRPSVDSGADADARACAPRGPQPPPKWVPSRPFHEPACTNAEVDELFAACGVGDDVACGKFYERSARCYDCAITDDSETTYGPTVIVRKDAYSYVNFGGCIGNRLGEPGAGGCGEAAMLFDQCRTRSCHGCFPIQDTAGRQALSKCLSEAEGAIACAAEASRYAARCRGQDAPDGAVAFCAGLTVKDYVRLWCTADPTLDGGAADSGDGG